MTDLSGQYFGRYYLAERLGEGGMAVVYKAYDTRLERDVALKIIRSDAFPLNALDEMLKRFEREAKSLAKLSHPNIVKVYDYGEHDGSPFLVMEYLPGGTLKKVLGKPVPWQDAVRLILPVARGVAYAHKRGILHRDIKPANVLITDDGEPMLSDFGIAKLFEADQTTALTGSGMAIGTPEYMAPEQWTGTTSPQSDLYSLGIVLYEMVAGRKPYVADTPAAILIKQATEPLPSPSKFAVDLPEALELVLIKALAKEPGDRYKDLNAFINALENLHVSVSIVAPAPEPKQVEETYRIPAKKPVVPDPTEIATQINNEPIQRVEVVEHQKIEEPLLTKVTVATNRTPIKFSRRGVGVLIGGIVILLAIWLGSPLVGKWFSSTPVATEPFDLTSPPVVITQTSGFIQTTATPTLETTPTKIGSQTPVPLPTEITDAKGVSMLLVPAGEFTMGSDRGIEDSKPSYNVYLDTFYIDKYEITNALYKACQEADICQPPQNTGSRTHSLYYGYPQFDNYPVVFVDWHSASTYCEWRDARLPTEAEWEKAARGTDGREYAWGSGYTDSSDMCKKTNYLPCKGDTRPVGSYEEGKSAYGIYDLTGNVNEWTSSVFMGYPYKADDGRESTSSTNDRVYRGGSFGNQYFELMVYDRWKQNPNKSSEYLGFRCAISADATASQSVVTQTPEPVANTSPSQITDEKGVAMLLIPAGSFTMGRESGHSDEKPVHTVSLDTFYIDKYEVTNALYKACVSTGFCKQPQKTNSSTRSTYYGSTKYDDYPVIFVDWSMAKNYCEWRGASLPTEAQWEKASQGIRAKANPSRWGPTGIGCFIVDSVDCLDDTYPVEGDVVGNSDYGVHNMEGNVWEWVEDWYDSKYYANSPEQNPAGPVEGQNKVFRGWAWYVDPGPLYGTYRRMYTGPSSTYFYLGFRCAKSVP